MQATYGVRRFQVNAFAVALAVVVLLIAATMAGLWVRGIVTQSSAAGISSAVSAAAVSSEREPGTLELRHIRSLPDQAADSSPLASRGPR
jgi:hypothetical protein